MTIRESTIQAARQRMQELQFRFGADKVTDLVIDENYCSFTIEPLSPLGVRLDYNLNTGQMHRYYLCEELDTNW